MEIQSNLDKLNEQTEVVHSIIESSRFVRDLPKRASIGADISEVSGLDTLGEVHGGALNQGAGSAFETMKSFAEQLSWLQGGLDLDHSLLAHQELANSLGLSNTDNTGYFDNAAVVKRSQPDPGYQAFVVKHPFVTAPGSISALGSQFARTKTNMIATASSTWSSLAGEVGKVARDLNSIANAIQADNSGLMFDGAAGKIREIGATADIFAGNANIMSGQVGFLSMAHTQGSLYTALAQLAMSAAPTPVERKAIEQAFLSAFPGTFSAMLAPSVPLNTNLMQTPSIADGTLANLGFNTSGALADLEKVKLPAPIQELVDKGQIGPGSFETVREQFQHLEDIEAIDPTTAKIADTLGVPSPPNASASLDSMSNIEKINDQIAKANRVFDGLSEFGHGPLTVPTDVKGITDKLELSKHLDGIATGNDFDAVGAIRQGIAGATLPATSNHEELLKSLGQAGELDPASIAPLEAPNMIGQSMGTLDASTSGRPAGIGTGTLAPNISGGISGSGNSHQGMAPGALAGIGGTGATGASSSGHTGARSLSGPNAASRNSGFAVPRPMFSAPGNSIHGGTNVSGAGAGTAGGNSVSGQGHSGHSTMRSVTPGAVHQTAGGHTANNGTRGPIAMGAGAPPAAGASTGSSAGKARRIIGVTSKAQRSKNKKALLGDAQPVVPGVIGSWVRES